MILVFTVSCGGSSGGPRASGDDPMVGIKTELLSEWTPRERG